MGGGRTFMDVWKYGWPRFVAIANVTEPRVILMEDEI
jgi:hypothetical protein